MTANVKNNFFNCTDSDHTEVDNTNRNTTTNYSEPNNINYIEQGGNQYSSGIPNSAHPNSYYQPYEPNFYFGQLRGWICPRCGRVNAPFMSQCTCKSEDYSNTNWTGPIDKIRIDCDSKNTNGNKIN